jgi:hypothetical protein
VEKGREERETNKSERGVIVLVAGSVGVKVVDTG